MNGVEILDIVKVVTEYTPMWGWVIGISLFILIASSIGIYFLVSKYDKHDSKSKNVTFSVLMGVLLWLTAFIVTGAFMKTPTAYENQYKVTISDEVSFNEFNEKYEVLDQEGKIYTVKERK